jgi:hypothetical protein
MSASQARSVDATGRLKVRSNFLARLLHPGYRPPPPTNQRGRHVRTTTPIPAPVSTDDSYPEEPAAIAEALRAEAGRLRADWELQAQKIGPDAQLLTGRIAFVLLDGTVLGTRASYVLRRDHGDWRIAHSHLSIPQALMSALQPDWSCST